METLTTLVRPALELTPIEFTEGLPHALVSVLERRYLSSFNADDWVVSGDPSDVGRPLMRDVLALGKPLSAVRGWNEAMPTVLAACHDPGHALVMVLHSRDGMYRLHLGARRIVGAGGHSTEDHLAAQESALKAHVKGLELGPVRSLTHDDMPELTELLQSAPWLSVVTGVPSRRPSTVSTQSLDRLVSAVGPRNYALMVVAEPMPASEIEAALDTCRHLKSEIHAYVRLTIQRSRGESNSESGVDVDEQHPWSRSLPAYLTMLMGFSSLVPGGQIVRGALMAGSAAGMIGAASSSKPRQRSTGTTWSQSGGVEMLDAHAQACEQILDRHIQRLQRARVGGWWRTAVYIVAEREACMRAVGGALRSLMGGDESDIDPVRMITPPDDAVRDNVVRGRVLKLHPAIGDRRHPLGAAYDTLATCLNSDELAVLVAPPQNEIPGIPMRARSTFALTLPADEGTIELGLLEDGSGNLLAPVRVTTAELNRHVLIVGVPGSGKTNTCMRLLRETYRAHNTPFLVIEPVKREYRALAALPEFRGHLRIYSAGSRHGLPLRLNPLIPVPRIPIGRHIDMLKAVFNASFPMHAGMPYVLEEALIDVYLERGWSLTDVFNPHLGAHAGVDDRSALYPDLRDLHDKIDQVLSRKQYAQEIHLNLGAALRSRLNSLMVGNKGVLLNTRRSTPPDDLFSSPTVIELQDLPDENEKAFVMALLLALLYEYAESRQANDPDLYDQLQHLTLVEEAHRLLSASPGGQASEVGDARGKAVSMFTDMLAEMRAYGEGFVIADQIPSHLAPQIVKNTSLKIIHRVTAPDDRQLCGSCTNLDEEQTRSLNNLRTGQAVVHDERIGEAVLMRVAASKPPSFALADSDAVQAVPDQAFIKLMLQRNAGCRACPAPCEVHLRLQEKHVFDEPGLLTPFLQSLLLDDGTDAWEAWKLWHAGWRAQSAAHFGKGVDATAAAYCVATQSAYAWIGSVLVARRNGAMTPFDRLQREHAARAMGQLVHAWLNSEELNASAESALDDARAALRSVLTSDPPIEREGCAGCPARCRMLPFVTPHLASAAKQITVTGGVAARTVPVLERLMERAWKEAQGSGLDASKRWQWLYCTVTNLDIRDRKPLLAELLRRPGSDEIRDVFGGGEIEPQ